MLQKFGALNFVKPEWGTLPNSPILHSTTAIEGQSILLPIGRCSVESKHILTLSVRSKSGQRRQPHSRSAKPSSLQNPGGGNDVAVSLPIAPWNLHPPNNGAPRAQPVVAPQKNTLLRPGAPKRSRLREARYGGRRKVGAQGPRLRRVIRHWRNPPKQRASTRPGLRTDHAFIHGQSPWFSA